mmetsp:Transcript_9990/g.40494  ORF Transcript_9990/g.40494 Transcript_9990/m.40494 type:complete len:340 (+) Transcript_9990:1750-2769(+)
MTLWGTATVEHSSKRHPLQSHQWSSSTTGTTRPAAAAEGPPVVLACRSHASNRSSWSRCALRLVEPCASRDSTALSKSKTSVTTSSPNAACSPRKSAGVRSASEHALDSASRTAAPATWCVSRNGTPLRTRYSARSVASMSGCKAARILAGWIVSVSRTPFATGSASLSVFATSNTASLSSWRSLLYADGSDDTSEVSCTAAACSRADLPRSSSRASGFRLCGISEEPVEYAAPNETYPNSFDPYTMRSSAHLERCAPRSAAHWANSTQKSRSETASSEFGEQPPPKPRSAASVARSPGRKNGCPASAPDPRGERSDRLNTSSNRSASRDQAHACDNTK